MKNSNYAAAVIITTAFALRLWGIAFGLHHADEPIIVHHALAYSSGDLNPHFFAIPPLLSYLLFALYASAFVVGKLLGIFPDVEAFAAAFVKHPLFFYVPGRILFAALPGAASVAVVWVLTRRFGERAALLAAMFIAVDFLHVRDSHYLYTDALMTLTGLLVVWMSVWVIERGGRAVSFFAGAAVGLAAAVKYNAALSAAAVATAHFIARRPFGRLAASGALSIVVFAVLHPYAFLDASSFTSGFAHQASAEVPAGLFHHLRYSIAGNSGFLVLMLGLVGLVTVFRGQFHYAAVVFAYPLVYISALAVFGQHHERYVLPVLPFVAIAAGIGADRLILRSNSPLVRLVSLCVIVAALLYPLGKTIRADILFSRIHTTDTLCAWFEANVPEGESIAFDHSAYRPMLRRTDMQWAAIEASSDDPRAAKKNALLRKYADRSRPAYTLHFLSDDPTSDHYFSTVRPLLPFSIDALRESGVRFVVIHYGVTPEREAFYSDLRANADRVARVSPYFDPGKDRSVDLHSVTAAAFSWEELFSRVTYGPVLEVYQLR